MPSPPDPRVERCERAKSAQGRRVRQRRTQSAICVRGGSEVGATASSSSLMQLVDSLAGGHYHPQPSPRHQHSPCAGRLARRMDAPAPAIRESRKPPPAGLGAIKQATRQQLQAKPVEAKHKASTNQLPSSSGCHSDGDQSINHIVSARRTPPPGPHVPLRFPNLRR